MNYSRNKMGSQQEIFKGGKTNGTKRFYLQSDWWFVEN